MKAFLVALAFVIFTFTMASNDELAKLVPPDAKLIKLAGDLKFVEGPIWSNDNGGFLVFSDIPADELKKCTKDGGVGTYRKPSHQANGNTRDREGRLISCEHAGRKVVIEEKD